MALERKKLEEKQNMNFFILSTYPLLLIILALFLDSPSEIADGLMKIIIHPGVLLVDYIAVGNFCEFCPSYANMYGLYRYSWT